MTPEERLEYWLNGPFDAQTKEQVRALSAQERLDAFCSNLSFGTGGLRALMGVGTNRMNIYTVRLATQGLANYLLKKGQAHSVLIGFDSRHHSQEFAQEAARVLSGNGVRVFLLDALRPTPYISFACREKKASAAIMITASHNPKEYNGYKVYWSDGGQVVFPHDEGIVKQIEALENSDAVKLGSTTNPLIERVSTHKLDATYLQAIRPLRIVNTRAPDLHIVYTSLHGTGITLVPEVLRDWGFSSIELVTEQVTLDGDFPTVPFPNPESPAALKLCSEQLEKSGADIALATDPDADRVGVVVRHQGKAALLSGNDIAALCAEFLARRNALPRAAIVTTIVTTELLKKIAHAHHITLVEVLTGFKYIGEKIAQWEQEPHAPQFLFGAEESYGYLWGTHARDKDALIASCLIASIALEAKLQGLTLIDALHALYRTYGVHREAQLSLEFPPGHAGMEQMHSLMQKLRSEKMHNAVSFEDYKTGLHQLPASDVLLFRLADSTRLVIRPSGTEPKLKIYASLSSPAASDIPAHIQALDARLNTLLTTLKQELLCP